MWLYGVTSAWSVWKSPIFPGHRLLWAVCYVCYTGLESLLTPPDLSLALLGPYRHLQGRRRRRAGRRPPAPTLSFALPPSEPQGHAWTLPDLARTPVSRLCSRHWSRAFLGPYRHLLGRRHRRAGRRPPAPTLSFAQPPSEPQGHEWTLPDLARTPVSRLCSLTHQSLVLSRLLVSRLCLPRGSRDGHGDATLDPTPSAAVTQTMCRQAYHPSSHSGASRDL